MPTQNQVRVQDNWSGGLDLFHDKSQIPINGSSQLDNVLINATKPETRFGKRGQLTTPFGAALYGGSGYIMADGSTVMLFVSGGKLYKWVKAATSATEVLIGGVTSFSLVSANVFQARVGLYNYIVDGSGPLYRANLDASPAANVITGQNAPTASQTASLTNVSIDDFSSLTGWTVRPAPSSVANLLQNSSFETTGGGSGTGLQYWTTTGSADTKAAADTSGVTSPNTDDGGTRALLLDYLVDSVMQGADFPTLASGPFGRARVYTFRSIVHQGDPTGNSTITLTVKAYSATGATGTLLGTATQVIRAPYNSDHSTLGWTAADFGISFTSLPTDPVSFTLTLQGGPLNSSGNSSIYIDQVFFGAVDNSFTQTQSTNSFVLGSKDTTTVVLGGTGYIQGGNYLRKLYGVLGVSGQNFSTNNTVSIALPAIPDATGRPLLRLGFQGVGLSTFLWTNTGTYAEDGTYISFDVSTIDPATLAAVQYLFIQIVNDLPQTITPSNFITIGPLTAAGNLAIGAADVYYEFTEVNVIADPDVIESDPSTPSNSLTPTGLKAQSSVVLPSAAPYNAATTYYYIYRFGGNLPAGVGYLVAKVSKTATTTDNAYTTWSYTTKTLTDNTPDGYLLGRPTLITGRGTPPTAAQAVCEWQGRLWLAKGGTIYGSWLVTQENPSALYFNSLNIPDDPYGKIKGLQNPVGGDNQPITNMISDGDQMLIFKGKSVYVIRGTNGNNFEVSHYLNLSGVGLIAPRAMAMVGDTTDYQSGGGQVYFLGADGVYVFQGNNPVKVSQLIEAQLNPSQIGNTAITAAAYKGAAMCFHGRRLFVFAPLAGDSVNTVAWVYDFRFGGWTKWLQMTATGAVSYSSATDTDDMYLLGNDGQIYQLTGYGDKATPASSTTAVTMAVASRGFAQETADLGYFRTNRPLKKLWKAKTAESATATIGVDPDTDGTFTDSSTYGPFNGTEDVMSEVQNGVEGSSLTVTFSVATATKSSVAALGVVLAETGFNR
jgi:hypothetical protein